MASDQWRDEVCGNCDNFVVVTSDEGECRLNPPQPVVIVSSEMQLLSVSGGQKHEGQVISSVVDSAYPPVADDTPACSQFAKITTAADSKPVDENTEPVRRGR